MPPQLMPLQGLKSAAPALPQPAPTSSKTLPGTPASYMGPEQGPFECDNCEYYQDPGQCTKPEVIQEQGGQVDPKGCCNFFESLSGTSGPSGSPNLPPQVAGANGNVPS